MKALPRARMGFALLVITLFALISVAVALGWQNQEWSRITGGSWEGISAQHWFGTNQGGMDIFARAMVGSQISFWIGVQVMLGSLLLGLFLGASAGWWRDRLWDRCVMWLAAVIDAIPFYLLALAVAYSFKHSAASVSAALVAALWPNTARLVRAEVLRLRAQDYIAAARLVGVPEGLIILRHVLPNLTPLLLIQATLLFVTAVKTEVVLSFIGLGVNSQISWGLMLRESAQEMLSGHWGNFLAATVLFSSLVLALNLLADALQQHWDPRQRERISDAELPRANGSAPVAGSAE